MRALDVYAERSRSNVNSRPSGMSDDAADEHRDAHKQPWQRVQVLVASACRGGVPASRARPGAL
jgi:hypothetical protein